MDWATHRARRQQVREAHGQWVGVLDRDLQPVMDVETWVEASWPAIFADTGSMTFTIPGEIAPGVQNPVVKHLLTSDLSALATPGAAVDALFHSAAHIAVERPYAGRRVYRILDLIPEGGRDYPDTLTITGVDAFEQLKHFPLWADPSNRSKIVQLQFADIQQDSAEGVSRKLLGRNAIGYQQPSLLGNMFSWTGSYSNPAQWVGFQPSLHRIIVSPVPSGIPSEWCIVEARWDNAWDLLKASWQAAGILPMVDLWWPGDPQPFPQYTTLALPTFIVDFRPCATVTGAAGFVGQAFKSVNRWIDSDRFTSVTTLGDVHIPTRSGVDPWVVFDIPEAPKLQIRKSTDAHFLVGGKTPKAINDLISIGIKTTFAALLSSLPVVGPIAAALITGAGEALASLSADRFLNLNEFTDSRRATLHGRSAYLGLAKTGEANSPEALQKAWQAKSETAGSLSIEFTIEDPYPHVEGRDFRLGDTIAVRCWDILWAAYISDSTWISKAGDEVGLSMKIGDLSALTSPEALFQANISTIKSVVARAATLVTN